MTDRKLGRRAPSRRPALRLSNVLAAVPAHPVAADHFSRVADWGLYENDRFGDCGPTSVANLLKLISVYADEQEQTVTQDDVFDLYRRSGNPNFDPTTGADDNGVDMQTMLDALLRGGIGGHTPVAFAAVDVSNIDEVRAAISIFGAALFGVNLETAQQTQTDQGGPWDYVPSGVWGGHAVVAGQYTSTNPDIAVVTWAEVMPTTDQFVAHQLEEAWVVIWPEHLTHPAFQAGIDLQQLAADYKALTGKDFPAPAPAPTPPPAPVPPPAPQPSGFIAFLKHLLQEIEEFLKGG